jgi:hypothetical protein
MKISLTKDVGTGKAGDVFDHVTIDQTIEQPKKITVANAEIGGLATVLPEDCFVVVKEI